MSPSDTPFRVDVSPDVETFIIASNYAVLQRGIGAFGGALAPGIYKVKFRRGTVVHEQFFELPENAKDAIVLTPSEPLAFESAIPTLESASSESSQKQVAAARDTSRRSKRSAGQGSIYLFIHRNPEAPPLDLRLRLYTLDEQLVGDVQQNAERDDPAAPTFAALNVDVSPGAYRLRCGDGDEAMEQIVIASSGWQTQVFITPQPRDDESELPLPLASAAILMSREGFDPENPQLKLAESARVALSYERTTMSRELLTRLVQEKFESPMLGIYAAHALAASSARDSLLEQVLSTLDSLVPGHPDVAALRIGSGAELEFDAPPMLRSSWRAIIAGSLDGSVRIREGSLASRLPSSLWPGTPWLLWRHADLLPAEANLDNVEINLGEITSMLGSASDAIPSGLTSSEEAMLSYLVRRSSSSTISSLESLSRPIDDHGLARAFGTTVAQVKNTVSGLAGKLKMAQSGVVATPAPELSSDEESPLRQE